ncbi:hypothetical protein MTR67_024086 [Solanum verrucosum]|uniref:Uncharacterized protein n=1 Tax=Solanum verrucosum TaxID=315347 RepID=A0AAF0R2A3_SOLVR|nr:hypothetical protein MTR67_024086 [Solanum verrucosum]
MEGKGKKRREKNYRATHGGTTRLPPPPNTSSIDVIPSKLRQIMAFSDMCLLKIHSKDQVQAINAGNKRKDDRAEQSNAHQKRNKKRKRKEVKTFGLIQLNWALLVQREKSERNS